MESASGLKLKELRVDGGASIDDLLMQFQCDVLHVPVLRPKVTETTALGAAYLAGIGSGALDQSAIAARWAVDRRFEAAMDENAREQLRKDWQRAVERSLKWIEA
jgi:glycerol kinase